MRKFITFATLLLIACGSSTTMLHSNEKIESGITVYCPKCNSPHLFGTERPKCR